ncbi:hypothetical protein JAAARDRAFT_53668 [Jaapia argillacea MUCL 33604]|uniref:Uncharacterized protein n=1 Tax=Jaapia argillacea MUCL 33604 TaxID=933084 RepID=A0A067QLI0_9AGAM|nr:hypothetical protein JAAARDRAFT_53668 [Jaapia argillacea MUCL 33604]
MGEGMQVDPEIQTVVPHMQAQPENQNVPISIPTMHVASRDIPVKVHIRRPERDAWSYLGRAIVNHEVTGHSARVVVRSATSGKIMTIFAEGSDLQAEKRGNFVVVGCVDGSRVVSWSLNALNNSDTLRLLASIELACYKSRQAINDPRHHTKVRRRIEKVIKEDRRKRHRRRKDQEAMIDAFSKQTIAAEPMDDVPDDL